MWKRLRTSPRRPFFWLALACIGGWFVGLHTQCDPWPAASVRTSEVGISRDLSVQAVSDDGALVLYHVKPITMAIGDVPEPQFWDTRSGQQLTPPFLTDPVRASSPTALT